MEESYPAIERARQVLLELRRRQGQTATPPVTLEEKEESKTDVSMGTGAHAVPSWPNGPYASTPQAQVRGTSLPGWLCVQGATEGSLGVSLGVHYRAPIFRSSSSQLIAFHEEVDV